MFATQIYWKDADVISRLHALGGGLVTEDFTTAIAKALAIVATTTGNHPSGTPGYYMWSNTHRYLADELKPKGWSMSEPKNMPVLVHPKGHFRIVVSSGNENTGVKDKTPSNKREKGSAYFEAISVNQAGFSGGGFDPTSDEIPTWIFLNYRDEVTGGVPIELSLPAEIAADGHVSRWAERIIFEAYLPGGSGKVSRTGTGNDKGGDAAAEATGDLDIPVERIA